MVGKLKQNLLLACLVISSVTVFYLGQHAMECHHRIEERSQPAKLESTKATVRTSLDSKANKTFAYHKDMPLIFIGGVPRSGTTLMRAMLDAHPDIRCGEETRVIPRILALKQMWSRSSKEKIRLDEAGVTDEVLDSAMQAFLLEIIVKHGEPAPYLCNKDPFALKSLTYLARLFPNAKFLLMVRDGPASVHSMISRKVTIAGFDLNSYRDCLAKWNRAIETMYNQCMEVGYKKCMLVHYEQLVLHPERWMRTLLKFLHVPWNYSVLHHEEMIGKGTLFLLTPCPPDEFVCVRGSASRRLCLLLPVSAPPPRAAPVPPQSPQVVLLVFKLYLHAVVHIFCGWLLLFSVVFEIHSCSCK
uniref:Protein-tyrosine sulfotransferase n=1 Tax=Marmota marmota marmota TaxID=9994 RepID=A0A8C5ZWN8_MARMA